MKNVLVAAYYFPPYANVSIIRSMKFCKYLPEFGWAPLVLTVNPLFYGKNVAGEIPEEIKKIKTIRIPFYTLPGFVILIKLLYPLIIILYSVYRRKHLDAVYITGSPYHPFITTVLLSG